MQYVIKFLALNIGVPNDAITQNPSTEINSESYFVKFDGDDLWPVDVNRAQRFFSLTKAHEAVGKIKAKRPHAIVEIKTIY